MRVLVVVLGIVFSAFSKDPFTNKENAVGYIVIDKDGETVKYIVLEGEEGKVKLIKTKYEPKKVLKQGGKK